MVISWEKNNEMTFFPANSKKKKNGKWITCLNMKTKTFRLLEENIRDYHNDYDLVRKNFSDSTINHRGKDKCNLNIHLMLIHQPLF